MMISAMSKPLQQHLVLPLLIAVITLPLRQVCTAPSTRAVIANNAVLSQETSLLAKQGVGEVGGGGKGSDPLTHKRQWQG